MSQNEVLEDKWLLVDQQTYGKVTRKLNKNVKYKDGTKGGDYLTIGQPVGRAALKASDAGGGRETNDVRLRL